MAPTAIRINKEALVIDVTDTSMTVVVDFGENASVARVTQEEMEYNAKRITEPKENCTMLGEIIKKR